MNTFSAQAEEDTLSKLLSQKRDVLEKQKAVSDEFNHLLTAKGEENFDEDGAIENSRKIMKNLEVAIVASRQPGYFSYHQPSKLVREIEQTQRFKVLTAKIGSFEKELEVINDNINKIFAARKKRNEEKEITDYEGGLKGWFAQYGRPEKETSHVKGVLSEFVKSPKVYGGTKHHQAFSSLAVTLKKGRLTR